jgi:probable F420-dependent oxidoreductase
MSYPLTGTVVGNIALRYGDADASAEGAAELESLGYSALWVPDVGGNLFEVLERLLEATSEVTIATGILNLWMHEAEETAAKHREFVERFGHRVLFGIGVSHAPLIDMAEAGRYRKPLARTREYLDALDAAPVPLPTDDRVLAALGPKMLELARTRAGGAHPYLVTPEHTEVARGALGAGPLLAPEQAVVLETDPARARELARQHLAGYLGLPNYANNWKRFGFTDEDTADGGSSRLVDALVVWGDEDTILARLQAHRDAGADHVCVQVLSDDLMTLPLEQLRRLAPVLTA